MYIRGLIPRNCVELAEEVPIYQDSVFRTNKKYFPTSKNYVLEIASRRSKSRTPITAFSDKKLGLFFSVELAEAVPIYPDCVLEQIKSIIIQAKIMCWKLQVTTQNLAALSPALVII